MKSKDIEVVSSFISVRWVYYNIYIRGYNEDFAEERIIIEIPYHSENERDEKREGESGGAKKEKGKGGERGGQTAFALIIPSDWAQHAIQALFSPPEAILYIHRPVHSLRHTMIYI